MTFGKSRRTLYTQKSEFSRTFKEEVEKIFRQASSRVGSKEGGVAPLPLEGARGSPGKKIGIPVKWISVLFEWPER